MLVFAAVSSCLYSSVTGWWLFFLRPLARLLSVWYASSFWLEVALDDLSYDDDLSLGLSSDGGLPISIPMNDVLWCPVSFLSSVSWVGSFRIEYVVCLCPMVVALSGCGSFSGTCVVRWWASIWCGRYRRSNMSDHHNWSRPFRIWLPLPSRKFTHVVACDLPQFWIAKGRKGVTKSSHSSSPCILEASYTFIMPSVYDSRISRY